MGKGYTIIGTKYTYNSRNQLIHRAGLIRDEEYDYTYDAAGNLLSDGRSKYEWNARGQLTKVTFPDGFGETYSYDMLGRRVSKTQFNHQGETQQTTAYHYKGDTWVLTEEVVSGDGDDGESTKSYTYDANDRPLTITFKGETFWYVYNGHGDVMALTDKDGNVAASYEYDAWGLFTRMYNRYGERILEGIGWIGDLGTCNGSPGSVQGPDGGGNGNTTPDYHPGNGNANGSVSTPSQSPATATPTETGSTSTSDLTLSDIVTTETEPTDDITTELVKENPIRYAGYYWDRKTQFYYLQARYYDPRPARFISEDSYEGEVKNPQSLNLYTYVANNPLTYINPSGHEYGKVRDFVSDYMGTIKNGDETIGYNVIFTYSDGRKESKTVYGSNVPSYYLPTGTSVHYIPIRRKYADIRIFGSTKRFYYDNNNITNGIIYMDREKFLDK